MDEPITTAEDFAFAQLAIRVHCSIEWPNGERCLNCAKPFPCEVFTWGWATLVDAGWTYEQINALDGRTGVWS